MLTFPRLSSYIMPIFCSTPEYAYTTTTSPGCRSENFKWIKNPTAYNVFDDNSDTCFNVDNPTWIQVPNSERAKWITVTSNVTTCAPAGGLSVYRLSCGGATCKSNPCYAKAAEGNSSEGWANHQSENIECSFKCEMTGYNRSMIIAIKDTGYSRYYKICDSILN